MIMVQASQAAELSGLTEHQLKEWCIRRALLPPDVPPRGKGHNALFGWQTLLALRLLGEIHNSFGGTVTHWGPVLAAWRNELNGVAFHALYGRVAVFNDRGAYLASVHSTNFEGTRLIVRLDGHLDAIAQGLAIGNTEVQLPLFPPLLVRQ